MCLWAGVYTCMSYQQRRHEYSGPYLAPRCQQHQEGKLWLVPLRHQHRSPAPPHPIQWGRCQLAGCWDYHQWKGLTHHHKIFIQGLNSNYYNLKVVISFETFYSPINDPFKNIATPSSTPTHRARMNGLLRPHRRVHRSLAEPITGVKTRPRIGLRNQVKL